MDNSDLLTRECALSELPLDTPATVVAVPPDAGTLLWHGIRPGVGISVETDAPFNGPRIVRIGETRLALARSLTRGVRVRRA